MSTNEVIVSGLTGSALSDSTSYQARAGKSGEQLIAQLHGKLYTRAIRGQVFSGATPTAGIAVPKYDSTAPTFAIWNPANSGKNIELNKIIVGMHTLGTRTVTSLQLSYVTGCGSAVATGAPYSAFDATVKGVPATITGYTASAKFSSSGTNTLTTAGTAFYTLPISFDNASAGSFPQQTHDFDGSVILTPGVSVYLSGNPLAPGSTFNVTLIWTEIPV
jgi:hypothetical protein